MHQQNNTELIGAGISCGLLIAIYSGTVALCTACWNYAMDGLIALSDKPGDFPLWAAFVLGLVPGVNTLGILAAVVVFVWKLFI